MARWVIISWYLTPVNLYSVPRNQIVNIRKLVPLGALNDIVQDQNLAVVGGLEDEDVLVLGLLVVEDFFDLEGHSLSGPHVGDLAEPSICEVNFSQLTCFPVVYA